MPGKNIEILGRYDRHGIYKKPDGNLVLLPVRRHNDWLNKNMEFVCEAANSGESRVKELVKQMEDERGKRCSALLEKYGDSIIDDFPELFRYGAVKKDKKKIDSGSRK